MTPRRKRAPRTHPRVGDPITAVPEALWTADFTGQRRTDNGRTRYHGAQQVESNAWIVRRATERKPAP